MFQVNQWHSLDSFLGATAHGAQGLFLALYSGIPPGGTWRRSVMPEIEPYLLYYHLLSPQNILKLKNLLLPERTSVVLANAFLE